MVTGTGRPVPGNLPAEPSSFVGRRQELEQVETLLASSRLVTLTGVGGVGKSRLALRVGARRKRAFRDGVWLVELASVRDPRLVAHTMAETLQLGEQSGRPPPQMLTDFLRERQLLVILDNCEHLPEACAVLADTLLHASPGLKILATSRQSLGVTGEYVWPVPPLPVPDPSKPLPDRATEQFAALELFADRAAKAQSGFAPSPDEQRDIARVCHHLDGIPLAIELAAVKLRSLDIAQLASRLDDRFDLLTKGQSSALPRHQTLRAAVEWSHELCSMPEQLLWARASVFPGELDLAAAYAVCVGDDLSPEKVLQAVDGLVDKSVLQREDHDGQVRFRLLETLREYGLERLRESGEESAMRRRHRDYFDSMAELCDADWFGPNQLDWYARLRADHANLRAALDFCLAEPGEAKVGLRMCRNLWFFWMACGQLPEGRHWLDRALAHEPEPSIERAEALIVDGFISVFQTDLDASAALLEGRTLARQFGSDRAYARATLALGVAAFHSMRVPDAIELHQEAVNRFEALAEPDSQAAIARLNLALAYAMAADPARGVELCRECRESSLSAGDVYVLSWADFGLANALWLLGRPQEATEHARECLRTKWRFADALGIVVALDLLAWIAAAAEEYEWAAVLLGASRQSFKHFGLPAEGSAHRAAADQACEQAARAALGTARYEANERRGTEFVLDEAIANALGEQLPAAATPPAIDRSDPLTRRERQVAVLVAEGLSNKQIAAKLMIAQRTAEAHVEHIMAKLGCSSRATVASWIISEDRGRE